MVARVADEEDGVVEQVRCKVFGEEKESAAEVVGGGRAGSGLGGERGVEGVGVGE